MSESKLFDLLDKGDFVGAEELLRSDSSIDINMFKYKTYHFYDYGPDCSTSTRKVYFLTTAFTMSRLDIADFLLSHGADFIDYRDEILSAIKKYDHDTRFEALKMILKYKGEYLLHHSPGKHSSEQNLLHYLASAAPPKEAHRGNYVFRKNHESLSYDYTVDEFHQLLDGLNIEPWLMKQPNIDDKTPVDLAKENGNMGLFEWMQSRNELVVSSNQSSKQFSHNSATLFANKPIDASEEAQRNDEDQENVVRNI